MFSLAFFLAARFQRERIASGNEDALQKRRFIFLKYGRLDADRGLKYERQQLVPLSSGNLANFRASLPEKLNPYLSEN